ncbi:MAG: hypothetical protein ACI835_001491 [Planctomycetota bacterium]
MLWFGIEAGQARAIPALILNQSATPKPSPVHLPTNLNCPPHKTTPPTNMSPPAWQPPHASIAQFKLARGFNLMSLSAKTRPQTTTSFEFCSRTSTRRATTTRISLECYTQVHPTGADSMIRNSALAAGKRHFYSPPMDSPARRTTPRVQTQQTDAASMHTPASNVPTECRG